MATTPAEGQAASNPPNGHAPQNAPSLQCLAQYTKDFSFENPNAPRSLQPQPQPPNISIQVNVNAKPLAEGDVEVELLIEGKAGDAPNLIFAFELVYGGVFRLSNIPQENVHPVIMIECPRLLFPFGRQIIADAVRQGGFPPLFIDPIDFASIYQQRTAETAPAGSAPLPTSN
jgi:preprotein translocase subunit SecB